MTVTLLYSSEARHCQLKLDANDNVEIIMPLSDNVGLQGARLSQKNSQPQQIKDLLLYLHEQGLLQNNIMAYLGLFPVANASGREISQQVFVAKSDDVFRSERVSCLIFLKENNRLSRDNVNFITQLNIDKPDLASRLLLIYLDAGIPPAVTYQLTSTTLEAVIPDYWSPWEIYTRLTEAMILLHPSGLLTKPLMQELVKQSQDALYISKILFHLANAGTLTPTLQDEVLKSNSKQALHMLISEGLLSAENIQLLADKEYPETADEAIKALVVLQKAGLFSKEAWELAARCYAYEEVFIPENWGMGWYEDYLHHYGLEVARSLQKHTPTSLPIAYSRELFQQKYIEYNVSHSLLNCSEHFRIHLRKSAARMLMSTAIAIYQNANKSSGLLLSMPQIDYLLEKAEAAELKWDFLGIRKWWNREEIGKSHCLMEALCCRSYDRVKEVANTNTGYFSDLITKGTSVRIKTGGAKFFK